MLKYITLLGLLSFCFLGCGIVKTLDPDGEQFEVEVVNCARDTSFVIENKGTASSAAFDIEGNLSHNAQLIWSHEPLDNLTPSSELPTNATEISLPAGKVNVSNKKDYYSKKLYVRYFPSDISTSGRLLLKIKI